MRETLTIRIPKIKLFGYHGCYDQEKKEGQEFEINMEIVLSIEYPISKNYPMVEDGLEAVFDYTKIVEAIKITFEGRRVNLLETLCEKICCIPEALREEEKRRWDEIGEWDDVPQSWMHNYKLASVRTRIKKLNPLGMDIPYVEVEHIRDSYGQ